MAARLSRSGLVGTVACSFLLLQLCIGDEYNHRYGTGEQVVLWANKVGPYNNPGETYNYYSLPFCSPGAGAKPRHKWGGLGEVLEGNEVVDSEIEIKFKTLVEKKTICSFELNEMSAATFKDAVSNNYWFEFFMDDLPLWGFVGEQHLDKDEDAKYMIFTHKDLVVKYNNDQIVQVNLTQENLQLLTPGKKIHLTYAVRWEETNASYISRFDAYLDYGFFEHQIHWFSIFNSVMVVIFLTGLVSVILMRTLRNYYTKYACEDEHLESLERVPVRLVQELYSATNDNKNVNFDIVLFHSLGSAGWETLWRSTWESPAGNGEVPMCWPAVWLPEDLDGIRVLSVSYDGDASKYFGMENMENTEFKIKDIGESFSRIMKQYEIGQRRFVLVGHGFGGLVIKSLMVAMKRLSHIPNGSSIDVALKSTAKLFLKRVQGIVYYAVPHRNVGAFFKHFEREGISRSLESWKKLELKMVTLSIEASDAFNGRQINLTAIGEGKPTNGEWVVQPEDAMLDVHNHYYRLKDCNHYEVCKPPTKEHLSYKILLELLKLSGAGKNEVPLCPLPPTNLLGIEENMANLEQILEKSSKVCVSGMGGIGKTTLVKEFYRRKSMEDFEASSILYEYKDVLLCQQKLLKDIGKDGQYNDSNPLDDKEVGKALLQASLSKKRVLIVLDNVGEDSIDYLIPSGVEWHTSSKVVLTSRDSASLRLHVNEVLEMHFLEELKAMELFCMHAFKEHSCPDKNLQEITNDIVDACGRLPLSLEVVGSFLSLNQEKKLTFWKGVLGKLKKAESLSGSANDKLWAKLKISFDDLGELERGKFLDVACFFCSELCSNITVDMALIIWGSMDEGCVELYNLIDRHLVTINEHGYLSMHDQLLAMGRNILRSESNYKHTRVLDECEGLRIEDVENFSCLEGLCLANRTLEEIDEELKRMGVTRMHKLRILIIKRCDKLCIEFLSTKLELKQLRWVFILDCSLEKLPSFSSSQMMTMYMAHLCHEAEIVDDFICETCNDEDLQQHLLFYIHYLRTLNLEGCEGLEQ